MEGRVSESDPAGPGEWTFLTNHAHVLLCLAADPEVRLRDVADSVGLTERAAQRIVMELEVAGYLERERVGRRNRYRLHGEQPLRHPMDCDHRVGDLIAVLLDDARAGRPAPTAAASAARPRKTRAAKSER